MRNSDWADYADRVLTNTVPALEARIAAGQDVDLNALALLRNGIAFLQENADEIKTLESVTEVLAYESELEVLGGSDAVRAFRPLATNAKAFFPLNSTSRVIDRRRPYEAELVNHFDAGFDLYAGLLERATNDQERTRIAETAKGFQDVWGVRGESLLTLRSQAEASVRIGFMHINTAPSMRDAERKGRFHAISLLAAAARRLPVT